MGETPTMTATMKSDLPQFHMWNSSWSKTAQELSGRTNNEINNWNIREKKRVRDGLPLYNDEFNDNGESSLSNQLEQVDVSQVDKSDLHGVKFQKDFFSIKYPTILHGINGNNFQMHANPVHISTMQPSNVSNKLCNNMASTSIRNNTSTTLINMGGTFFMIEAMESNLPPKPKYLGFQSSESPKLVSNMLYNNVENTYTSNHTSTSSINMGGTSFMIEAMESNMPPKPKYLGFQSSESPKLVSNMLYNNVENTSTSNHTSTSSINMGRTSFMTETLESNLPPKPKYLGFQSSESPKLVSNMLYNNVENTSTSNHTTTSSINMGRTSFMTEALESNLPPKPKYLGFQYSESPKLVSNMLYNNVANTSTSNHTSTSLINMGGTSFMTEAMESNLPPKSKYLDFQSFESPKVVSNMLYNNVTNTSTSNHTSPTLIHRYGTPFMTMAMESDLPPFSECSDFQSPNSINVSNMLHNNVANTSISNNTSPIIDRGQTSLMCATTESDLPPFPDYSGFQSHDSPLIHKYPVEEIPFQSFEPDSSCNGSLLESMLDTPKVSGNSNASHMHSCETRSVDEKGKMPISLEKDESNDEDLIDVMYRLGWFDDI